MTAIVLHAGQPLQGGPGVPYQGIACDGAALYLTAPGCGEIHRYDLCGTFQTAIPMCRPYTSLCFDPWEHCFWALCSNLPEKIFRLDCSFQETGVLSVSGRCCGALRLTGLSCLACHTLLLSGNFGIASTSKQDCPQLQLVLDSLCGYACHTLQATQNGCLAALSWGQSATVALYDPCWAEVCRCCLPKGFCIHDMARCAPLCSGEETIFLLASGASGAVCLFSCVLCPLSPKPCHPCPPPKPCPPTCSPVCDSAEDIRASIAKIETALSHILNAEGEKIQKIVADGTTADEILAVNKSVNSMVDSVARLEMLLQSKLTLFGDCLCEEPPVVVE